MQNTPKLSRAVRAAVHGYSRPNLTLGALALCLAPCGSVFAFQFESETVSGSLDTTVSYGTTYRAQAASKKLIARSNGGSVDNGPIVYDDGDLNFRKGELVSEVAKVVSDLDLRFQENYGVFVRGRAFYDFELKDDSRRQRELSDDGEDLAGSSADLLDAFVYGSWELGNHQFSARLGRQVINWGESIFAQGGISATNPYDVGALRAPGSEIKEAFLPTLMGSFSFELTENMTLEGYWQPGSSWEAAKLDACGTFFSTTDVIGDDDCDYLPVSAIQESVTGLLGRPTAFDSPDEVRAYLNGVPAGTRALAESLLMSTYVPRSHDVEPDGDAQYGISLRWTAPELNQSDFGLYYLRYSTQTPVVSAKAGSIVAVPGVGQIPFANRATYFAEYLGKRDLYGFSFNTTVNGGPLDGLAVAGELSYRPDSIVSKYTSRAVISPAVVGGLPEGTYIPGYVKRDRAQATLSGIYLLPSGVLSADSGSIVAEVSANRIYGSLPQQTFDNPDLPGGMTNSSWGATTTGSLTYNDIFGQFTVSPGVSVYSAINGRNGANNKGERAYTAKVDTTYKEVIGAGISYTAFNGGGRYNRDRDFLSLNLKYSF
ncbi:DUF1302 domain-containing protein [Pseudomonas ogarae]|uniref:DUF1302 domain-containing protein n=1 Tax=Pseudomonas ogarae (strain DSM 112162 / CECT 30235 / F113) TaxID=1114970 RepID=UPI0009E2B679|nr:DUF1302 domain-containing protein [Pseudomonas ogarae]